MEMWYIQGKLGYETLVKHWHEWIMFDVMVRISGCPKRYMINVGMTIYSNYLYNILPPPWIPTLLFDMKFQYKVNNLVLPFPGWLGRS